MGIGEGLGKVLGGVYGVNTANSLDDDLLEINPNVGFSDQPYDQTGYAGDFNPTMLDTPEAAQYQTVSEDPRVRQMQMDALQTLIDRSSGATDAKSNAAQYGALSDANQLAQGREQAIAMDMARKGQSGSGMDAVMRANAAQAGANRARMGTQDAVTNAALEKLTAQNAMLSGAGSVRSQDFQRNAANSDIVNRFNQFNTSARNAAKATNAGAMNSAGLRNMNTRQDLAGTNTNQRNASLDRSDRNKQTNFTNNLNRFGVHAGIMNQGAQAMNQIASGGGEAIDSIGGAAVSGAAGMYGKKPRDEDQGEWI